MKRKDRIYEEIQKLSRQITKESLLGDLSIGYSAELISANLNIARNTVSQELNLLNVEGKLIKIKSRPVLFVDKRQVETLLNLSIDKEYWEIRSIEVLRQRYLNNYAPLTQEERLDDPFKKLIGYDQSLKDAINKAKSALLYPPNGLHVLLSGDSGVGKTYFAELMHKYYELYQSKGGIIPFVYFNCSEYYNNPELLTGQLFGYTKGAFTGAVADREGLVQQADGGFLFLDEIHRLPAEGQEKLFSLLDKGTFRKLGSSNQEQAVNVRLIGATTCDITATFLKTFLRRIPVVIKIPSLEERSFQERLEMILKFLQQESIKTKLNIHLTEDFAYYMMTYHFDGNIGALKSEIQYKCAQAFLNVMTQGFSEIVLDDTFVTETVRFREPKVKETLEFVFKNNNFILITAQNSNFAVKKADLKEIEKDEINFYALLMKEYHALRDKKVSHAESKLLLENKISTLFQYTYNKLDASNIRKVEQFIEEPMVGKISKLIRKIEEIAERTLDESTKNNVYLHMYTFLAYMKKGTNPPIYNTPHIMELYQEEYEKAKEIGRYMSEVLNIPCPKSELIFMTLFLNALCNNRSAATENMTYGIVVIAHGDTTATSMANFANTLFKTNIVQAIDMPLDRSVSDTLEELIELVKQKKYKELVILVDMGSLTIFGEIIEKQLRMETVVVKNITTGILLEVTGKFLRDFTTFQDIKRYIAALSDKHEIFVVPPRDLLKKKSKILITSCVTGIGTANKIKILIEQTFKDLLPADLRIESKEYHLINTQEKLLDQVGEDEEIIGVIGTFTINLLDIPFISLEELFSENGINLLIDIIGIRDQLNNLENRTENITKNFVSSITLQSIVDYLTILNPQKILQEMEDVLNEICKKMKQEFSKQTRLRFLIHCCCMVERIIVAKSSLKYQRIKSDSVDNDVLSVIKVSFATIENHYGIKLSYSEIACIYELLFKKTP
ncbi:sigma-54 dependent dga operon transcriptional activator [Sporomusaceae bacterium BoRhaA]|uniref:transcriptional regulator DagR n=1 Tax=Pelorhabdus rhamnosifermentans TaxID=2772457 RepID=UPI001C06198C|nr:sigma-54-dependent transcriptional regulator [Pelorhabdus rhamnosifermentans]MBU2702733.1 sigma-54 dependent dga operon transcriptional activator [Pelorhabdus rhamnosifermentans]